MRAGQPWYLLGECHRGAVGSEALEPSYSSVITTGNPPNGASARRRSYRPCTRVDLLPQCGHRADGVRERVRRATPSVHRCMDSISTSDRCGKSRRKPPELHTCTNDQLGIASQDQRQTPFIRTRLGSSGRTPTLGDCARPYGTPCQHEHSCLRCPMLRVSPGQRPRLIEIIRNLSERIAEARTNGWLGEVQGLQVSLTKARRNSSPSPAVWNAAAAPAAAVPPTSACPSSPDRGDRSARAHACQFGEVMRGSPARMRRSLSGPNRQRCAAEVVELVVDVVGEVSTVVDDVGAPDRQDWMAVRPAACGQESMRVYGNELRHPGQYRLRLADRVIGICWPPAPSWVPVAVRDRRDDAFDRPFNMLPQFRRIAMTPVGPRILPGGPFLWRLAHRQPGCQEGG